MIPDAKPCPPHDFGIDQAPPGYTAHHFRNGHYWLICRKCKFTIRSPKHD